MPLTVAKPTAQPKLTVTTSKGGLQGSSVNPQKTAPVSVVQNANYNPQKTAPASSLQPAANAAAIQAAATAAAAAAAASAAAAETARKTALKVAATNTLNTKISVNTSTLSTAAAPAAAKVKLRVGRVADQPRIVLPKDTRSDYQKAYDDAFAKAQADANKRVAAGKKNIFQKAFDKVTFGTDRREVSARAYADGQAQKIAKKQADAYQKNLNSFLKEQANRKSNIEKTKFQSQAAFEYAKNDYDKWQKQQVAALEKSRGVITGGVEGYTKYGQRSLDTKAAKLAQLANNSTKPAQAVVGKVWQYTLGSGSKNLPSLVTAPSRLVNLVGNLNTKDRTIYKEGGTSENRSNSNDNAWQSTFNQRSFNLKPWTDQKYSQAAAEKKFGKQVDQAIANAKQLDGKKIGWTGTVSGGKKADPKTLTRDYWLHQYWDGYNQVQRGRNSALDLVADPLNIAGGAGAVARGLGWTGKAAEALKITKAGKFLTAAKDAAKSNKVVSWLGAEAKSPTQKYIDALDDAKIAQGNYQQKVLPRVQQLRSALKNDKLDYGVFDELGGLSDGQAKALQRMTNGKFAVSDRLKLAGNKAGRDKLTELAARYQKFTDDQALADNITERNSRFLNGRKQYFARTNWLSKEDDLKKYNFRAFKKHGTIQSSRDLHQSQIDRFFKSALEEQHSTTKVAQKQELDDLLSHYDETVGKSRAVVDAAYRKTRTPYGRARGIVDKYGATALWKKSVLKYRPAWYVNNVLYNTQAAGLAGGGRALLEQGKMLHPGYFRKAMDAVPKSVKADLAPEIGRGKLSRFGNGLENWSRVAAFRGAKAKGLSDDQALKRVNKYLFDYKTRNFERPLRAVVPFYSFQKNLIKASATMPFDRPGAALAYNRVDRLQQQQFNDQFDKEVAPGLKKLGYSDAEIEKARTAQSVYYGGKFRLPNGKYITTPFNAFSDKGLSNLGINPYVSMFGEVASGKDQYGLQLGGRDSTFAKRAASKFPQAQLALEGLAKYSSAATKKGWTSDWIGKPGNEGYGLTKEAQGYDPTAKNYQKRLDKGVKFNQDATAFFGAPRQAQFDTKAYLNREALNRAKSEYFAGKWHAPLVLNGEAAYNYEQDAQKKIFKKYGITADQFFKGELAKYDTTGTKKIKDMKEDARKKTTALYDEYAKQPYGTKSTWATQKLRELNATGYFDKNPFLKSFDWLDNNSIVKADKTLAYRHAKESGDWSGYNSKYGDTRKQSKFQADGKYFKTQASMDKYLASNAKFKAAKAAAASGDWSGYRAKYGTKTTPFTYDGKYFKTAESMAKYQMGKFWDDYSKSSKTTQAKMLADHPEYDTRKDWTAADWNNWRAHKSDDFKNEVRAKVKGFADAEQSNAYLNKILATPVLRKKGVRSRYVKVAYALQK